MAKISVAGYVKLAKLWDKHKEDALNYHKKFFEDKFKKSNIY